MGYNADKVIAAGGDDKKSRQLTSSLLYSNMNSLGTHASSSSTSINE